MFPEATVLQETTILLVDDQPAVRFGLRLLIQLEFPTITICEASSSAEALAIATSIHPDLIIMDVELPDRNGIATAKQLMRLRPGCLVIILTLHGRHSVRSEALTAGVWAFVEKGRPEDLRAAIRQAICFLRAK
jgi:DNA-binding NarL/FixJ family response regulator